MASTWDSLKETYNYVIDDLSHPCTRGFFMSSSPGKVLAILVVYNLFCLKIGPWIMKHRKPFELKTTLKLYNIFQVLLSAYIAYEATYFLFFKDFNFTCQPIEDGEPRLARGVQLYFLSKIVDLLDTVFFVLRKSDRQITFLHLYHHTLMPIVTWIGFRYFPGGQGLIVGCLNCIVHVVMYSYYFLSSLGPKYQKYLWWKKYLTLLQILQFTLVLIHSLNSLRYDCGYPTFLKIFTIVEAITFTYLFGKFYIQSYKKDKTKSNGATNVKAVRNGHSANGADFVKNTNSKHLANGSNFLKNGSSNRNRINKEKSNDYENSKKIKGL